MDQTQRKDSEMTKTIDLTDTWVEIATSGFVAQAVTSGRIEIRNDDALPTGDQPCHVVSGSANLDFPFPASGSWYARVRSGDGTIVVTEV